MTGNWYAFKSSDKGGEVELSLYDEIGAFGIGAKEFIADLRKYKGQHVHVRINSPGGEIIDGSAIANALNRHDGGVTVHIDGLAASMASYIAMSGNPTFMSDNALLMIHNPWTLAAGESADLRKQADLLDTMKATLVRGYQRKSGMEAAEISRLMDEETWLTALEAAALGLIDAIEDGIPAAASATDMRARFDKFARRMDEKNSPVVNEVEAAPAVDPIVEAETAQTEAPAVEASAAEEVAAEEISAQPKADEELAAHLDALTKERDEARESAAALADELKSTKEQLAAVEGEFLAKVKLYDALKRSLGVNTADQVVPATTAPDNSDPVEQFKAACEARDWKLCADLYGKHKPALIKARNSQTF